ncbi:hypothetical protein Ancab_000307 [Ancistrocladus abbreviatus]
MRLKTSRALGLTMPCCTLTCSTIKSAEACLQHRKSGILHRSLKHGNFRKHYTNNAQAYFQHLVLPGTLSFIFVKKFVMVFLSPPKQWGQEQELLQSTRTNLTIQPLVIENAMVITSKAVQQSDVKCLS